MQQAHMVQQVHDMQCMLQGYNFDGDNFINVFGAAECQHMQCSNCNTYKTMPDLLCDCVPHNMLNCQQKCNMCKMLVLRHLRPADSN